MRPSRRWAKWGIVILVLVLGLCGLLVGCGSGQETSTTAGPSTSQTAATTSTTAAATTSTTAPAPTTTASSTTTTEALSGAETRLPNGNIKAMGFIDKVWEEDGTRYISIDLAEMLTGEEAVAAAVEAGDIAPGEELPNDYFIRRNVNQQKQEFTVAASASILTATRIGGSPDDPQPATWTEFMSFWSQSPPEGAEHMPLVPWWIERNGTEVISVTEQYIP